MRVIYIPSRVDPFDIKVFPIDSYVMWPCDLVDEITSLRFSDGTHAIIPKIHHSHVTSTNSCITMGTLPLAAAGCSLRHHAPSDRTHCCVPNTRLSHVNETNSRVIRCAEWWVRFLCPVCCVVCVYMCVQVV
ncbi:hypothetical protein GDO78_006686 [Eleutherodactylus coqui]|uniref:Uncharacterized protein n=1 Tax=Eleutherodactylus coqui TaxID=57060 RepID=A0A8J6FDY1_ELECQ|nr:hypothetical protein GDO78_006686 [Eleutherodactylus coqui]